MSQKLAAKRKDSIEPEESPIKSSGDRQSFQKALDATTELVRQSNVIPE
jgi:hypothetical protein